MTPGSGAAPANPDLFDGIKPSSRRYKHRRGKITLPPIEIEPERYGRRVNLSRGVSYRQALQPEKWPAMRKFIATFERYADIAQDSGKSLDAAAFIKAY